jgi:two-component system, chemotaxis family, protein-glutamate methylesterase/glutaminase
MQNRIRAFVVDDSGFVVASVKKKLETDSEIEVVGSARDGKEAIEKIRTLKPDVITLDVVMPEMDGLAVLEQVMAWQPTPVVMLSALTSEGAATTIRALELGAVDFFLKPSILHPAGDETGDTLIEKVKRAAISKMRPFGLTQRPQITPKNKETSLKWQSFSSQKFPVVVIGSSTGGPRALMQLIPALPSDFPAAILIVQHMPPLFTKSLAERLNHVSRIKVDEASEGSMIEAGQALLAPGSYHMVAGKGNCIKLNQDPPVLGVRPSIDVTMKSVVEVNSIPVLGIVLTGMGSDGTLGASYIKAAGGKIIAQDESTCAVYGMPQSVIKAGYVNKVLPLPQIAPELIQMYCSNSQPDSRSLCYESG